MKFQDDLLTPQESSCLFEGRRMLVVFSSLSGIARDEKIASYSGSISEFLISFFSPLSLVPLSAQFQNFDFLITYVLSKKEKVHLIKLPPSSFSVGSLSFLLASSTSTFQSYRFSDLRSLFYFYFLFFRIPKKCICVFLLYVLI